MKGSNLFCHLDITDAYSHLVIDDKFGEILTLNTPTQGLVRPTGAVYGAANITAVWQRRMEMVLQGLEHVHNFFDDILVFAENFEELMTVLEQVLERLRVNGLKFNRSKCVFATKEVEFLGHHINGEGLMKADKHMEAIRNSPRPSTIEELQLFLGKATYYCAFIHNMLTKDRPLRQMLKTVPFQWTPEAEEAYNVIKEDLLSPRTLITYDPQLPLVLATDASKTRLSAVLSHRLTDAQERPIAFASRPMNAAKVKYPQN
uniref:RNA-directed DNA polymerase n=1 Tax=Stomoxys calcitrans TaxID=35570 RepID=A0A1I8Q6T1_STOCA